MKPDAVKGAALRGRAPPLAQQQRERVARTRAVRTGNPSCCLLTSHMAPLSAPFNRLNPKDSPLAAARYANKLPSRREQQQDAVIRLGGGGTRSPAGSGGSNQISDQIFKRFNFMIRGEKRGENGVRGLKCQERSKSLI